MLSDKDSVRVDYVDPISNKKAFIERKYENGAFVKGVGANPLKIELPCVKEVFNAENRAELEIRKLFYLRETVTDTFLSGSASIIEQGDMVRYEEIYNDNVIGGEIIAINGNNLTLSENIPDGDVFIEWQTDTGGISQQYQITKITEKTGSIQSAPTGAFVAGIVNAKGSSYVISTPTLLTELEYISGAPKPSSDGKTVQLILTKHDKRVYDFDEIQGV